MSLDGLRAWIGVVERKLAMRTRVFLVLVAIAIGGAGAAIYLSLDAQSDRVGEGDLSTLQEELTSRIDALETRVEALEASQAPAPLPAPGVEQQGSGGIAPR
jgi:hypothetical protein